MTARTNVHSGMLDALGSDGPHPDHVEALGLFGQFVGAWALDGSFDPEDGEELRFSGRWLFDWILDGRGIQDVLVHDAPDGTIRRGTTVRIYDAVESCWRIVWLGPVSRTYLMLTGRADADGILVEGNEGDAQLRWTFNDITPTSFLWLGHTSADGGVTWRLEQKMHARRDDA